VGADIVDALRTLEEVVEATEAVVVEAVVVDMVSFYRV
jgi:hypothetical protein